MITEHLQPIAYLSNIQISPNNVPFITSLRSATIDNRGVTDSACTGGWVEDCLAAIQSLEGQRIVPIAQVEVDIWCVAKEKDSKVSHKTRISADSDICNIGL